MQGYDVAIVGGGITGLAHAHSAAKRGLKVVVVEQNSKPIGASVRNFGLVLPLAQLPGKNLDLALKSYAIWKEVLVEFGIWNKPNGLLVLGLNELETRVMQEFVSAIANMGYGAIQYLNRDEIEAYSPGAFNLSAIQGALYSPAETTINPVETVKKLAIGLHEKYGVDFRYNTIVKSFYQNKIETNKGPVEAERILLCTGEAYEQFYPELYTGLALQKCKLQMLRLQVPPNWQLNQAVASGISMLHYSSFTAAPSLQKLKEYYNHYYPELERNGIHILAVENNRGELLIGDSHKYSEHDFEPGDSAEINKIILDWVQQYLNLPQTNIIETWHGVYLKSMSDSIYTRLAPANNIRIVTAVGGQGMTISFGVAEETFEGW